MKKEGKMKKHGFRRKNPLRFSRFTVVVVTFFVKILDDFHDFVSECTLPFMVGLRLLLLGFVWSFLVLFSFLFFLLDFHGRVRVVRSMYLPAALHGIELCMHLIA